MDQRHRVPAAAAVLAGLVVSGSLLAVLAHTLWGRAGALLHAAFGLCMLGAAAFSVRPWVVGMAFDAVEDHLHSIAATAMGSAFAFGVVAVAYRRYREGAGIRVLDVIAVGASIVLPLGMAAVPDVSGVLQRAMFLIAYLWFGREAFSVRRHHPDRGVTAARSV